MKIISKTASAVRRHKMALLAAGPHEATTATLSDEHRTLQVCFNNKELSSILSFNVIFNPYLYFVVVVHG